MCALARARARVVGMGGQGRQRRRCRTPRAHRRRRPPTPPPKQRQSIRGTPPPDRASPDIGAPLDPPPAPLPPGARDAVAAVFGVRDAVDRDTALALAVQARRWRGGMGCGVGVGVSKWADSGRRAGGCWLLRRCSAVASSGRPCHLIFPPPPPSPPGGVHGGGHEARPGPATGRCPGGGQACGGRPPARRRRRVRGDRPGRRPSLRLRRPCWPATQ